MAAIVGLELELVALTVGDEGVVVGGAAHFLRETIGRVRYAGATGQLTRRADSGFFAHAVVVVGRIVSRSGRPSSQLALFTL